MFVASKWHVLVATLIVASAALLVLRPAHAQIDASQAGSVESVACPISVPETLDVECGELTVPENYEISDGATVRLPYIILRNTDAKSEPDPIVYTAGGPGYSSLGSVWFFVRSPILAHRDVIVFEQRGNRYADPALTCDESLWWKEGVEGTPCLDAINASGVDITQYTTENIVRDLIALRNALGYQRWNLYGGSFSTSLMLLMMEADELGTRSAILQSVKPPSETTFAHESDSPLRAIENMFADCAANNECAAAYPDMEEQFYSVVRQLNAEPVEVEAARTDGDEPIVVDMDGDRFIDWIVVYHLYQPAFPPFGTAYLPLLISEIAAGNLESLEPVAQAFWSSNIRNPNWAWGLMLAVNCQQDLPVAGTTKSDADIAAMEKLDGFARSTSQRAICASWGLSPQAPAATDYVRSDVPALVLAGAFDPVTPPAWSRTTAEHLTNSTYVEFPGHGHDVTADNPCVTMLEVAFLDNPGPNLDVSCLDSSPTASFVLPNEIFVLPGLAQSGREVSVGAPEGVAWIEAVVVLSILGSAVLALVLGLLGSLSVAGRRTAIPISDGAALATYVLAICTALAMISLPILLTEVHESYPDSTDIAFALGPSRDLLSATLLAWITPLAGAMALTLAVTSLWAWVAHRWHRGFRIVISLVVVFSLPMLMLALRWGLFTMLL